VGNVRELAGKIKIDGIVTADEPMREHTSFRIGGPADLYAAPRTVRDLTRLLSALRDDGVPLFILGGGTNLLVSDRGIRGAVVDTRFLREMRRDGSLITAGAGAEVSAVSALAADGGLSGMEFAYFLPGSLGGALWMNARCYERSVSDILESAQCLEEDLSVNSIAIRAEEWGYKLSPFQGTRRVVLSAGFRLTPGDPREVRAKMETHRRDREAKGHFLFPCAGSVFKNNRAFGAPTGKLLDSLGLKGRRIGGAQVAPFHGNIFINVGGATAADMKALIELAEKETQEKLGFSLEREVILAGEW
jgi:UDP-N-acetylmuramate dehydrogenase